MWNVAHGLICLTTVVEDMFKKLYSQLLLAIVFRHI